MYGTAKTKTGMSVKRWPENDHSFLSTAIHEVPGQFPHAPLSLKQVSVHKGKRVE
jgi:hypothetical protein